MSRHFSKSACPRYIPINNCHNNPFRGCLLSFTGAVLFTLTSNSPPSLDYCGSLRWDRQPWLFMNTICTDTIYLGLIMCGRTEAMGKMYPKTSGFIGSSQRKPRRWARSEKGAFAGNRKIPFRIKHFPKKIVALKKTCFILCFHKNAWIARKNLD